MLLLFSETKEIIIDSSPGCKKPLKTNKKYIIIGIIIIVCIISAIIFIVLLTNLLCCQNQDLPGSEKTIIPQKIDLVTLPNPIEIQKKLEKKNTSDIIITLNHTFYKMFGDSELVTIEKISKLTNNQDKKAFLKQLIKSSENIIKECENLQNISQTDKQNIRDLNKYIMNINDKLISIEIEEMGNLLEQQNQIKHNYQRTIQSIIDNPIQKIEIVKQ